MKAERELNDLTSGGRRPETVNGSGPGCPHWKMKGLDLMLKNLDFIL